MVAVIGLTGSEANLRLYADVDGDGNVDPEDHVVWSTILFDNSTPWSPVMPVDSNLTPGLIVTDIHPLDAAPRFRPHRQGKALGELGTGRAAEVISIGGAPADLAFLAEHHIAPGAEVVVGAVASDGSCLVTTDIGKVQLAADVAATISVVENR